MPTRPKAKRKILTEHVETSEQRRRRLEAQALRRNIRANKQVRAFALSLARAIAGADRGLKNLYLTLGEYYGADALKNDGNVELLDRLHHRVAALEDTIAQNPEVFRVDVSTE